MGGYDVMAACQLPKLDARVRFPLPAPGIEPMRSTAGSELATKAEPRGRAGAGKDPGARIRVPSDCLAGNGERGRNLAPVP
jgi:hypothetical protein